MRKDGRYSVYADKKEQKNEKNGKYRNRRAYQYLSDGKLHHQELHHTFDLKSTIKIN